MTTGEPQPFSDYKIISGESVDEVTRAVRTVAAGSNGWKLYGPVQVIACSTISNGPLRLTYVQTLIKY